MSTTLGKYAGVALLLAAGLVLALYAAGVFSARPASADGHALTDLWIDQGPGRLVLDPPFNAGTQTADVNNYMATFPRNATATQVIKVVARANGSESTTVTVAVDGTASAADDTDTQPHWASVLVRPDTADTQDMTGTLITVTASVGNQSRIYRIRLMQEGVITNTKEAGAVVRLIVKAPVRARVGSDITLGLSGFVLPTGEINRNDITINDGENLANPGSVSKSGSNITLTMGRLNPDVQNSDDQNELGVGTEGTEEVTITIASKAGIKNPTKAGTYLVTVDSSLSTNPDGVDARRVAEVERTIKITPKTAGKKTLVTVTGTGFTDGDAQIFQDANTNNRLDDNENILGTATVTKGAFTFETNAITGNTTIQVVDFNGDVAVAGQPFTIKASIKVTPAEVSPAENVTVELVDWSNDTGIVSHIRFGGSSGQVVPAPTPSAANGAKITVQVPASARLGGLKVEALVGNTSKAEASVTVRAHTLTISPTSAVPRQVITIQGSGFRSSESIKSITFDGGRNVYIAPGTTSTLIANRPVADSQGNITITVSVPDDVNPGRREIEVKAVSNRVGQAVLTVPEPVMTVDPTESLRGTTITVTGRGFASEDLIQIKYQDYTTDSPTDRPVTTANTDTTGNFTASFPVPSYARIGDTQKVVADSQLLSDADFPNVSKDHKTPKPTITLSPGTAAAGSTINVSGINFAGFAPVAELMIDDRDVKPVPTPATERDGSITMRGILVPQLDAGSYTVKLRVGDKTVTKFIQVTDEPVSSAPADVFESVVESLTVVWHYDNETQSWTVYRPTGAAAVLNNLESVATGAIVWVQVAEQTEFRHPNGETQTLYVGWNLITIK